MNPAIRREVVSSCVGHDHTRELLDRKGATESKFPPRAPDPIVSDRTYRQTDGPSSAQPRSLIAEEGWRWSKGPG